MVFCTKRGYWWYSAQHWSQCTRANTSQTTTNEGRCSNERSGVTPNMPPPRHQCAKKQTNKNKQNKNKKHASRSNMDTTAMYNWNYVGVIKTYVPFIWSYIDLNVPQRRSTRYLVPTILSAPKLVSLNRQVIRETGMSAKHSMWSFVTVQMNTNEILSEQTFY